MPEELKLFQVERDGPVIIWKYNNPPKNLGNPEMIAELMQLQDNLINDPELRVGIFTSALPDVYIQHWDVSNLVDRGRLCSRKRVQLRGCDVLVSGAVPSQ